MNQALSEGLHGSTYYFTNDRGLLTPVDDVIEVRHSADFVLGVGQISADENVISFVLSTKGNNSASYEGEWWDFILNDDGLWLPSDKENMRGDLRFSALGDVAVGSYSSKSREFGLWKLHKV